MRVLLWFRKDLRLDDHLALDEAVRDAAGDVVPFYTSEPALLGRADLAPTRVRFVLESLAELSGALAALGSQLTLAHGDATVTVLEAARASQADAVYWNDEYEPILRARDDAVERTLKRAGFRVRRFADRLLVPPGAVMTRGGTAFSVFTPFARASAAIPIGRPRAAPSRLAAVTRPPKALATLEQLGLAAPLSARWPGGAKAARARLTRFLEHGLPRYATHRDRPAADAGSRLSADLKFGTISVRAAAHGALEAARADRRLARAAEKFVSELRWRDFFAHVLFHHPEVEQRAFRRELDAIAWPGDPAHFDAWRQGRTGYPLVDAGMRELAATGLVHNRVRMVVASFLAKDLLLDWRLGERHFMTHLVDGDLASNNGGWQWAASTGTDAQPWFRVFNPVLQGERFDPDGDYVRRWVPELASVPAAAIHRPWEAPMLAPDYAPPLVDHARQRERAIQMYRAAARAPLGARDIS